MNKDINIKLKPFNPQQIASDTLFIALSTSLFVVLRARLLRTAFLRNKLTPITTALLAFERRNKIDSHFYYFRRASCACILGSLFRVGEIQGWEEIVRIIRGVGMSLCFGLGAGVGLGIGLGLSGGSWYLEKQLLELM